MKNDSELFRIREKVNKLENVKDDIIEFFNQTEEIDKNTKIFWISDAKECYYQLFTSFELVKMHLQNSKDSLREAKNFLEGSNARFAQVISELQIFKSKSVESVISSFKKDFNQAYNILRKRIDDLIPAKIVKPPIDLIKEISGTEYQILCDICGEVSVIFRIGKGQFDKEDMLLYEGITHSKSLLKHLADLFFPFLEEGKLSEVHDLMQELEYYEGLDAYCPECDKTYCWEHYNPREVFDEGFYDCTYATCPKGHTRIIDD